MSANATARTETYHDVEKLIYQSVWEFIRYRGGDFHELLSVANETYLKCYDNPAFDTNRSQFHTWLKNNIRYALLDSRNGRKTIYNTHKQQEVDFQICSCKQPAKWDCLDLLGRLSRDGKELVS